jgi:hypothetical protein
MERSAIAVRVHAIVGHCLFYSFCRLHNILLQWSSDAVPMQRRTVIMLDRSFNVQIIKAAEPQ